MARCMLGAELKQLRKFNSRPNRTIKLESATPTKDHTKPGITRFIKYNAVTESSEETYITLPSTEKLIAENPELKSIIDCTKGLDEKSRYSIVSACLGPFVDSRHWYAEAKRGNPSKKGETPKVIEKSQGGILDKLNVISLEQIKNALRRKSSKNVQPNPKK